MLLYGFPPGLLENSLHYQHEYSLGNVQSFATPAIPASKLLLTGSEDCHIAV